MSPTPVSAMSGLAKMEAQSKLDVIWPPLGFRGVSVPLRLQNLTNSTTLTAMRAKPPDIERELFRICGPFEGRREA